MFTMNHFAKQYTVKITQTVFIWLLLTLTACVTINVYFPASQAEKAAERIVDEILGKPADKKVPEPNKKETFIDHQRSNQLIAFMSSIFINDAVAGQPDFSVNTPQIKRLRSSMASRNHQLTPFYQSGALGFANNGLVSIKDNRAVSLKQRGALNSLMNAENNDRNGLYQAIADANGHPEWEKDVRAIFAKKWSQKARSGWWYQTSNGSWQKK